MSLVIDVKKCEEKSLLEVKPKSLKYDILQLLHSLYSLRSTSDPSEVTSYIFECSLMTFDATSITNEVTSITSEATSLTSSSTSSTFSMTTEVRRSLKLNFKSQKKLKKDPEGFEDQ